MPTLSQLRMFRRMWESVPTVIKRMISMKMKNMKALLLAAVMLFALTLTACGSKGGEATYKVSITDAVGTPYTDVAVKFMQDGQQVAMQLANENGVAEKVLTKGDYTVQLQFTDPNASFVYDESSLTLSADKTELNVVLSMTLGEEYYELSEGKAYYVSAGSTNISLNSEGRSYYIFQPTQAGQYEVSLSGSDAPIGYYGGSVHYIWTESAVEVVDNKFSVDVKESQLGGALIIIGVDAGNGNAVLNVKRLGDPAWSIEDEPWTVYNPTVTVEAYQLPAGTQLNKFDITAAGYTLVLNETDHFYHLDTADGPLVYVQVGNTSAETDYLPPFETILEKQGLRRYFFEDEAETKFLRKEEYSECVLTYIENADEASGVYPLTEDLKYIIENVGIQMGWFDAEGPGYLFKDTDGNKVIGVNSEISWLFMCRYAG